ncbi:hypothetical protein SORBI_3009G070950 [Sorghum bicolor]|uniref:Uncharacterized protein n=1 Tax=Sorghum bicolor TaxID=4558 RepID=A0A1Z5R1C0_SORBI|nr:hypothetical protein SORBI_3009G070950 [Sorghum bicolor]
MFHNHSSCPQILMFSAAYIYLDFLMKLNLAAESQRWSSKGFCAVYFLFLSFLSQQHMYSYQSKHVCTHTPYNHVYSFILTKMYILILPLYMYMYMLIFLLSNLMLLC